MVRESGLKCLDHVVLPGDGFLEPIYLPLLLPNLFPEPDQFLCRIRRLPVCRDY